MVGRNAQSFHVATGPLLVHTVRWTRGEESMEEREVGSSWVGEIDIEYITVCDGLMHAIFIRDHVVIELN